MGKELKRCPRCGEDYPRTLEYFTADAYRSSGLAIYCKQCAHQRRREYRKNHPEQRRAEKKRYRERYPEKTTEWLNNYRERLQNAEGSYTEEEWNNLCRYYKNKCLRCGKHLELVPDHVIPLSKGGTNYIENIQPLCKLCNAIKTDREWDFR